MNSVENTSGDAVSVDQAQQLPGGVPPPPKVLIVDDMPDNVKLLYYLLENQGYRLSAAYNGQQALDLAAAEQPDVILLDVMMPGMDGIEVCRRLKADERLRMIPVILVTARDLNDDVVRGLDAGADDYVTKPYQGEVLAARLRSAIRLKQSYDLVRRAGETQRLESVGLLAGGIAHEFNNLLQVIGGYATCALENLPRGGEPYQDLQQVLKAVDRAATLTGQLLGFSRRRALHRTDVDPNDVVADLAKLLKPLIGDRIAVEVNLRPDIGAVYADAGELQQVLLNLCLNARDAMPDGGRLLLETAAVELAEPLEDAHFQTNAGRHVVFRVSDTGQGMAADVQQHIFEPFFTTKDVGKGTGLGLSLAYGVVQQHKGLVRVQSQPNQGTTFEILLPCRSQTAGTSPAPPVASAPQGHETILVAEDEPLVRDLAVRVLRRAGYAVLAAADGEEALRSFQHHCRDISLVLLDVVLPKLNGREVCRRIKAGWPEARILFASGYDPQTTQSGFIMEERLRLIEKPFHAEALLHAVREVLDEVQPCLQTSW